MIESADADFRLLPAPGSPGVQIALPPFDPRAFQLRMHLDRVQLLVEIEHGRGGGPRTDFRAIRASCDGAIHRSLSVSEIDGRRFLVNVQEPDVGVLVKLESKFKADFGGTTSTMLKEVEVALDLLPRDRTYAAANRATAVAFLRRYFAPEAIRRELGIRRHWPRVVLDTRKTVHLWKGPDWAPGFAINQHLQGTFYVGAKSPDGIFFKIYEKRLDNVGGPHQRVLADDVRPVRLEATISGSRILEVFEGNTIDALITNRCRRVGRLFAFMVPVVPSDTVCTSPFQRLILQKKRQVVLDVLTRDYGVYGAMLGKVQPHPNRGVKCGLRAHAEMRERVQAAFRAFQKRIVA